MAKLVKNISLSIIEGRTVRDLLYNDLLIHLNKKNIEPTIFSEASNIPEFTGQWNNQKAKFVDLEPSSTSTNRSRAYWMRRRISKLKTTGILEAYIHYENKFLYLSLYVIFNIKNQYFTNFISILSNNLLIWILY